MRVEVRFLVPSLVLRKRKGEDNLLGRPWHLVWRRDRRDHFLLAVDGMWDGLPCSTRPMVLFC